MLEFDISTFEFRGLYASTPGENKPGCRLIAVAPVVMALVEGVGNVDRSFDFARLRFEAHKRMRGTADRPDQAANAKHVG
jgi:hypothetical protein